MAIRFMEYTEYTYVYINGDQWFEYDYIGTELQMPRLQLNPYAEEFVYRPNTKHTIPVSKISLFKRKSKIVNCIHFLLFSK